MSYYFKAALWYAQGMLKYTSGGYEKAAKGFNSLDIDVSGRTFLVTGGSTGIGKSISMNLVSRRGTTVHIVCRDPKNGEEAMKHLSENAHSESQVYLHLADLSNPQEVIKLVNDLKSRSIKINVLINNAGALMNDYKVDDYGYDKSFFLNVISVYLLTDMLAQVLNESSTKNIKSRVVTVSSGGMLTVDLDPNDPSKVHKPYDGTYQYALYKRQQVTLMDLFSDKYPDIHFSSMHPGWVDTPGVQNSLPSFYSSHKNSLRTVEQGADTAIWLSISDESLNFKSGTFFFDRQPAKKFLVSHDDRYAREIETAYLNNLKKIVDSVIVT